MTTELTTTLKDDYGSQWTWMTAGLSDCIHGNPWWRAMDKDHTDLKSVGRKAVWVRVPPWAPMTAAPLPPRETRQCS
jgi:hypothetical protein